MRPTARYWVTPVNVVDVPFPLSDLEQAVLSWHSDHGIGSLLRYSLPRIESINQVAVRYVVDGWELEGVAWVERDAVQAVALYNRRGSPQVRSTVSFMWVAPWDTEREIWERLQDLPAAVSRITQPGIAGHVVLIGADRWAVAKALPMAVESLSAWQVEPAGVAAWTYSEGWQAASGASMLDGAGQPFRPGLAAAPVDRFVWPRARRRLGKTRLESIINACPWTRPDARSLYLTLTLVGEHPGAAIAHYAALAGKGDKDTDHAGTYHNLARVGSGERSRQGGCGRCGDGRQTGGFFGTRAVADAIPGEPGSERGRGASEATGRGVESGACPPDGERDAWRLMLGHGELSYREIVRRSEVGKLGDRFTDRLVHEDVLVDLLGRYCVVGCEVAPASRARTVNEAGFGIDPDGMLYCCSPVGTGYHYLELERSRLGPTAIKDRLEKYRLRLTSYPLAVICKTDPGGTAF